MSKDLEKAVKQLTMAESFLNKTAIKVGEAKEKLDELKIDLKAAKKELKEKNKAVKVIESAALRETRKLERAEEKEALKDKMAEINQRAAAEKKALRDSLRGEKKKTTKRKKETAEAVATPPDKNGVKHPKADSVGGKVWSFFDSLSSKGPVELDVALSKAPDELKPAKIKAEYKKWIAYWGG